MSKSLNTENNILLKNYIKLYLNERSKIHKIFPVSEVVKIIKRIFYILIKMMDIFMLLAMEEDHPLQRVLLQI